MFLIISSTPHLVFFFSSSESKRAKTFKPSSSLTLLWALPLSFVSRSDFWVMDAYFDSSFSLLISAVLFFSLISLFFREGFEASGWISLLVDQIYGIGFNWQTGVGFVFFSSVSGFISKSLLTFPSSISLFFFSLFLVPPKLIASFTVILSTFTTFVSLASFLV